MAFGRLFVTDEFAAPPVILRVDDSVIGTLGNFSASTGKAKSKKTFNVCAIVAAAMTRRYGAELFGLFAAGEAAYPLRRYGAEPLPLQAGVVPDSAAGGIADRCASAVVGVLVPGAVMPPKSGCERSRRRSTTSTTSDWSLSTAFAIWRTTSTAPARRPTSSRS